MFELKYSKYPPVIAILQARVSSSRLPSKVLKPILNKPMLAHQIQRLQKSLLIDQLILATSNETSDDPLEKLAKDLDITIFRGSLNNVLDRFYQAVLNFFKNNLEVSNQINLLNPFIVRLTGDCPVIDVEIVDSVIKYCIDNNFDYASNTNPPTFPDGMDVEIFKFSALKTAWELAKLPSELEHVTPFIRNKYKQNKFKLGNFENKQDLSGMRLTVDEPEDFECIEKITESLYSESRDFNLADILNLAHTSPDLFKINQKFERNEGMKKSLERDLSGK